VKGKKMINVEMTVTEMVNMCGLLSLSSELRQRIIAALEKATKPVSETNPISYRFNLLDYNPERKIAVIKEVRLAFNWGLREAKDWVENANPDNMVWSTTPWMTRENAVSLRDRLIALDCACGPVSVNGY
jgi:ribosomal protein L7/L12